MTASSQAEKAAFFTSGLSWCEKFFFFFQGNGNVSAFFFSLRRLPLSFFFFFFFFFLLLFLPDRTWLHQRSLQDFPDLPLIPAEISVQLRGP